MKNAFRHFLIRINISIALSLLCYAHVCACNVDSLKFTQSFQTFGTFELDSEDKRYAIVKIDEKHGYTDLILKRTNNNNPVQISFYEVNPCDNGSAVYAISVGSSETRIPYDEKYKYAKITTSYPNTGFAAIKTVYDQSIGSCSENLLKFNTIEYPTIYPELSEGTNCYELCNKNCNYLNHEIYPGNKFISQRIRWIKIPVDPVQNILELNVNSEEVEAPSVLFYGMKANKTFFQDHFDLGREKKIIQAYNYDYILLGVYDNNNKEGNFDLCIKKFPFSDSCIDFFGDDGQKLEAIYTSKESPLDGPYLYGEHVTFRYQVNNWMPIKNNWLHGIKINYGKGWKGFLKDSITNRPIALEELDTAQKIDTTKYEDEFLYMEEDSVDFSIDNFPLKQIQTPAWYNEIASSGPRGPAVNFTWGKKFKRYKKVNDESLFEFIFTLVADSIEDCTTTLDGTVLVLPLTDYETGRWTQLGCPNNNPVTEVNYVACCNTQYTHSFQDTTLCSGEVFDFANLTADSCTYTITNQPLNNYTINTPIYYEEELELSNRSEVADTLMITMNWGEGSECPLNFSFTIVVKPMIEGGQMEITDVCKNERINLTKLIQNNVNEDALIDYDQLENEAFSKDSEGISWLLVTQKSRESIPLKSDHVCLSNLDLRANPDKCEKETNEGINIVAAPNPTLGPVDLIIENGTDETQWILNVYNKTGNKVYSKYMSLTTDGKSYRSLDFGTYYPGTYWVSVSNEKFAASAKIILMR